MQLSTGECLIAGALTGSVASALTNPLDVVVCRLATQGAQSPHTGFIDAFSRVYAHYGFLGFTRGMMPRVCFYTPHAALQFAAYETLKRLMLTK